MAFDDVSQVILSLIGVRENVLLYDKNENTHRQGECQDGKSNSVNTDTAGLEGEYLIGFVQYTKGHQGCDQHGNGDEQHQGMGKQIEEVIQEQCVRQTIFNDIVDQLKKGKQEEQ